MCQAPWMHSCPNNRCCRTAGYAQVQLDGRRLISIHFALSEKTCSHSINVGSMPARAMGVLGLLGAARARVFSGWRRSRRTARRPGEPAAGAGIGISLGLGVRLEWLQFLAGGT